MNKGVQAITQILESLEMEVLDTFDDEVINIVATNGELLTFMTVKVYEDDFQKTTFNREEAEAFVLNYLRHKEDSELPLLPVIFEECQIVSINDKYALIRKEQLQ